MSNTCSKSVSNKDTKMTWSSFFILNFELVYHISFKDYFKFLRIINSRSWKLCQLWLTVLKTVVNSNPIKLKAKNIFPLVGFSFTKLIKEMKYWLLVLLSQSILAQCFVSIPPKNVTKSKVLWRFFDGI